MSNAGIVARPEFNPIAMEKTLNEVYMAGYNLEGDTYSRYMDVRESEKRQEEVFEFIGPSEVQESNEGGVFQRVTIEAGLSKQFLHLTYKTEIKITKEMIEDVQYGQIVNAAKMLGIAAKRTVEKKCADVLLGGFTSQLAQDGEPWFDAAHPVLSAKGDNPTTWSNLITTPFSSNAVKELRSLGRKQRDENGDLSPCKFSQLIVGPDLEWVAGELLESNLLYDTANNAKNGVGKGLELIVVDHFNDNSTYGPTAFIMRDPAIAMNILFWRKRPEGTVLMEESTGDALYRTRMRLSVGIASPRGAAASTGLG